MSAKISFSLQELYHGSYPYTYHGYRKDGCFSLPSYLLLQSRSEIYNELMEHSVLQLRAEGPLKNFGLSRGTLCEGIFYCLNNIIFVTDRQLEGKFVLAQLISSETYLFFPSPNVSQQHLLGHVVHVIVSVLAVLPSRKET